MKCPHRPPHCTRLSARGALPLLLALVLTLAVPRARADDIPSALPGAAPADVPAAVLEAEARRADTIAAASPAVVAIFSAGGDGGGSGVLISPDGYALSNFHVTRPAGSRMKCGLPDGRVYEAVIVGCDPTGDVALIKLTGRDDFPAARWGRSDQVRVGDWVFALGNPFLLASDFQPTATYGIVSGVSRYQGPAGTLLEYTDCLQIDASINPGNSGGPLFNAAGELIGINGRGSFEKRGRVNVGVAYAISLEQIKRFLGCLKSGRIVDHATLGAIAASDGQGRVVVAEILPESDAHRRGLRWDDELVELAGRPLPTVNAFKNVLGTLPAEWRVPLKYRRDGELREILVRLAGVHRPGELEKLVSGFELPGEEPRPKPPVPDEAPPAQPSPAPSDGDTPPPADDSAERQPPNGADDPLAVSERPGFANYRFNERELARVVALARSRADLSAAELPWRISARLAGGSRSEWTLNADRASARLPGGPLEQALGDSLVEATAPDGSGGLLAALWLWQRWLRLGPQGFETTWYWGTMPLWGRAGETDVVAGLIGGASVRMYFSREEGDLLALEFWPDPQADPAELYFHDYAEQGGAFLPRRIEVRRGDEPFATLDLESLTWPGRAASEPPRTATPSTNPPASAPPNTPASPPALPTATTEEAP